MTDTNPDLESFRKQWQQELFGNLSSPKPSQKGQSRQRTAKRPAAPHPAADRKEEDEHTDDALRIEEDITEDHEGSALDSVTHRVLDSGASTATVKEPKSALEHYEEAVEKEAQGSLGDSLNLYRKAYRLDDQVDKKYKNKHFPPSSFSKTNNSNPSNAAVTVPNPAHPSLDGPPINDDSELAEEFQGLFINGAPPPIEGTPAPPCPIASLPSEVLIELLTTIALGDVAAFVRIGQVCKLLGRLISTEENIWKLLCVGKSFGFAGMQYSFACDLQGLPYHHLERPPQPPIPFAHSWKHTFQHSPRIRYTGVYISTVNYTRPGASSLSQVSWNTPVHIVTYYRYLRFFRDGSLISLLTTTEPSEVVHNLTKENLPITKFEADQKGSRLFGDRAPLQHPITKSALRGRWYLSDPTSKEGEAEVHVETEGVDPKYMYSMHFALRSIRVPTGIEGSKNTKLVWKGFWSYNRLTDDWAEFGLRNDRAFVFSTVRSYGLGQ